MVRIAQTLAAAAVLALCAACGTSFIPDTRPASVTHLDIVRKQEYILGTKATLKIFRTTARDLRSRNRPLSLREFADRFERYVTLQVAPIISDFEAENNLATRLEIAKLQLLCGLTYIELAEGRKARNLLEEMQRRYGANVSLLNAPLDRGDLGIPSLEDGLLVLKEKIAEGFPHAGAVLRLPERPVDPRKVDPWKQMSSTPYPMRSSVP